MTKDVKDAVRILNAAYEISSMGCPCRNGVMYNPRAILARAIMHIAYPDRDIYPKTRRATKGAPIVCQ